MDKIIDVAGAASLEVEGLRICIVGRQFPAAEDYWDANWLQVCAKCEYPGSVVEAQGPILHLSELQAFLVQLSELNETLHGQALLNCMEPNLKVSLHARAHGKIDLQIDITPDHLAQTHQFRSEIDQTFLSAMIRGCREILAKYPLKGTQS